MGPPDKYAELLLRIEKRRQALNGMSEAKACNKAGLGKDCIRTIRRGNAPRADNLVKLASALECMPSYLLEAIGIDGAPEVDPDAMDIEEDPETGAESIRSVPGYVGVRTLTDRPGMGGAGGDGEPDNFGPPELLPERLVRVDLRGEPHQFLLLEVDGPSMSPILESGDRVLIDLRKKNPSQPGIFVVHEGLGYVAKWVQYLPHSEPPSVKITSENVRFEPYNVPLDDARILGRVVWFARRL